MNEKVLNFWKHMLKLGSIKSIHAKLVYLTVFLPFTALLHFLYILQNSSRQNAVHTVLLRSAISFLLKNVLAR